MTVRPPAPTVFVVDDDASVRKAVQRLLRTAGYRVVSCASADEFLSQPAIPRPSCLLLDVRMPDVSGLDLQETLRTAPRRTPVILMSGHADVATAARARAAGAVAFLSKPFDDVSLLAAVRRGLQQDGAASDDV